MSIPFKVLIKNRKPDQNQYRIDAKVAKHCKDKTFTGCLQIRGGEVSLHRHLISKVNANMPDKHGQSEGNNGTTLIRIKTENPGALFFTMVFGSFRYPIDGCGMGGDANKKYASEGASKHEKKLDNIRPDNATISAHHRIQGGNDSQ